MANGFLSPVRDGRRVRAWRVRWYDETGHHSRTFPAGAEGKREAERFLAEIRERTHQLTTQRAAPMTVGRLVREMMRARRRELSPAYLATLEAHADAFAETRLWARPVSAVHPSEVAAVLRAYADAGLSTSTIRGRRALLSAAWAWGITNGHAATNPVREVRTPTGSATPLRAVRRWEVLALAEVAEIAGLLPSWAADTVLLLGGSGMRIGEALGLTVGSWDRAARLLTIERTRGRYGTRDATKTGPPRTISLPVSATEELLDRLTADRPATDPLLLGARGGPVDEGSLRRAWARALAQLPHLDPRLTPRHLRHTCATALLSAGVPVAVVAQHLGHASPRITQERYAGWVRAEVEAVRGVLDA